VVGVNRRGLTTFYATFLAGPNFPGRRSTSVSAFREFDRDIRRRQVSDFGADCNVWLRRGSQLRALFLYSYQPSREQPFATDSNGSKADVLTVEQNEQIRNPALCEVD